MVNKEGWIKIHRSLMDSWLWKDEPYDKARAWIDLLLLANWEDRKVMYRGELVTCKRGDVNLSFSLLADRWNWSRKKTTSFLKMLERDGMVSIKSTPRRTVITIVNYGFYQGVGTTEGTTEDTTEEHQRVQQKNTTKKYKEILKNNKKGFSNFKQTEYDFEELEKKLTGL